MVSFGHFEPQSYQNRHLNDTTSQNIAVQIMWQSCSYFTCAMNESKSVLHTENQPLVLCPVCLHKLQKAVGFDVVERYTRLCILLN